MHHNKFDHTSTGWKSIVIIMGDEEPQDFVFEYNLLIGREGSYNTPSECDYGSSVGLSMLGINGARIRYNVMRNTRRSIFSYDFPSHNILIEYNTFERNCFAALQIMSGGTNYEVYNNVFTDYSLTPAATVSVSIGDTDVKFRNNIFYSEDNTLSFGGGDIDQDYNIFYPDSDGAPYGAHSFVANPMFIDAENGDFRLQQGSPAIGAGVSVGSSRDLDQNSLVGVPDIGAYEYQG